MQPLPFNILEDNNTRVVFEGNSSRIQFVAPMPGYLGMGGPQVQILELVNGLEGMELIFNHHLLQTYDPNIGIEREPLVLVEGITDASFVFQALDDDGELLDWSGNWDKPDILPVAVRLDLAFAPDQQSIWPLLVTGAKIDITATTLTGGAQTYSEAIQMLIERPGEPRR